MHEDQEHTAHFERILRYLSGNAEPLEVQELERWVQASEANKREYLRVRQAWLLSGMTQQHPGVQVEEQWERTAAQLFPSAQPIPLYRRRAFLLRTAAAILLLFIAVTAIIRLTNRPVTMDYTSADQVENVVLPDSSQVALNQFTQLQYILSDKNYRRVQLQGDAFFRVKHDDALPFQVFTSEIEIEVLGTAFYVDARANQAEIQIIVESGSVAVRSSAQAIVLKAGEMGVYERASKNLYAQVSNDVNFLAWETNVLRFQDTPLERVLFDLERKYHRKLSLADERLRSCPLTATYQDKSLEAIISILEETFQMEAHITDQGIEFTGAGCD